MNTATLTTRLTAAASAALLALTFAGCASTDTPEPDRWGSIADARQGAVRYVPSDDDPRGLHFVCEALPTTSATPGETRSIPGDDDPRGRHGFSASEIAQWQQRLRMLGR